jgi:hypothetical protein
MYFIHGLSRTPVPDTQWRSNEQAPACNVNFHVSVMRKSWSRIGKMRNRGTSLLAALFTSRMGQWSFLGQRL